MMDFGKDSSLIGLIAGSITTASGLPQAWNIYKTNDTESISLAMCVTLIVGEIVWCFYAFILRLPSLLFFSLLTVLIWEYITYKKISNLKTAP